jgi:hypothetical protein
MTPASTEGIHGDTTHPRRDLQKDDSAAPVFRFDRPSA